MMQGPSHEYKYTIKHLHIEEREHLSENAEFVICPRVYNNKPQQRAWRNNITCRKGTEQRPVRLQGAPQ